MHRLSTGVALLLLFSACSEPATDSAPAPADTAAPAPELAAAPDSIGTAPLLVIMQQLASDMNTINEDIWRASFDSIAAGAAAIAYHPKVPAQKRRALAGALGDDFKRFAQTDQQVHELALELQRVARTQQLVQAQKMDSVLHLYSRLQRACVACHTDFRQRVRSLRR